VQGELEREIKVRLTPHMELGKNAAGIDKGGGGGCGGWGGVGGGGWGCGGGGVGFVVCLLNRGTVETEGSWVKTIDQRGTIKTVTLNRVCLSR